MERILFRKYIVFGSIGKKNRKAKTSNNIQHMAIDKHNLQAEDVTVTCTRAQPRKASEDISKFQLTQLNKTGNSGTNTAQAVRKTCADTQLVRYSLFVRAVLRV